MFVLALAKNVFPSAFFWYRIVSAAAPWVAAQYPASGKKESFNGTVLSEGRKPVFGTGRGVPAGVWQ